MKIVKNELLFRAISNRKQFSYFVILFGFVITVLFGFYINPLIVDIFHGAEMEIPSNMSLLTYSGTKLMIGWLSLSAFILVKDKYLHRKISFIFNWAVLILLICLLIYYPVFIDAVHLPMINE